MGWVTKNNSNHAINTAKKNNSSNGCKRVHLHIDSIPELRQKKQIEQGWRRGKETTEQRGKGAGGKKLRQAKK